MAPSPELAQLLARLQLASAADLRRCQPFVRKFARGLPAYDSVWLDALVRRRMLTPFQARALERRDTRELMVDGPILVLSAIHLDAVAPLFHARDQETGREYLVTRFEGLVEDLHAGFQRAQKLVAARRPDATTPAGAPLGVVRDGARVSVLAAYAPGEPLNRLLVRRGRFPEPVVRAIACEIAAQLAVGDNFPPHGDLRLSNVWLSGQGETLLINWGLLTAFIPQVTIHTRLPQDAADALPPERCEPGKPVTSAGDLYALGCLLWQLLTGRPPFPTIDPLGQIAAHRGQAIADVRSLAPDASPELAQLLRSLTAKEPHRRPPHPLDIRKLLHANSRRDRQLLKQFVRSFDSAAPRRLTDPPTARRRPAAVAAGLLLTLAAAGVAWQRERLGLPGIGRAAAAVSPVLNDTIAPHAALARNSAPHRRSPLSNGHSDGAQDPSPGRYAALSQSHPPPPHSGDLPASGHRLADAALRPLPAPDAEGKLVLAPGAVYRASGVQALGRLWLISAPDRPATILVRDAPLDLTATTVTLESVWIVDQRSATADFDGHDAVPVRIRAGELAVRHCGFRAYRSTASPVARGGSYIGWEADEALDPHGARLLISDTVFRDGGGVRIGVPLRAALVDNVLKTGAGPLFDLQAGAAAGLKAPLVLRGTTLFDSGPLVSLAGASLPGSGRLSLQGAGSVFDHRSDAALAEIVGALPEDWERHFEIAARGLITSSGARLAGRREHAEAPMAPLKTDGLTVDGLLVGTFHFATDAHGRPTPEQLVIDSLPVRLTAETPGIRGNRLPPAADDP